MNIILSLTTIFSSLRPYNRGHTFLLSLSHKRYYIYFLKKVLSLININILFSFQLAQKITPPKISCHSLNMSSIMERKEYNFLTFFVFYRKDHVFNFPIIYYKDLSWLLFFTIFLLFQIFFKDHVFNFPTIISFCANRIRIICCHI